MEAINDPSRSNIQIDHNNQSSTSSDDEEIRKVDQPDAPSPYLHNA
jgi:hypothetical protein